MLRATAKTHKVAVFKNQHTELGESITLSEFWVPIDANHSELQRIKWDAKTVQRQKATNPAHLIGAKFHWYLEFIVYSLLFILFDFQLLGDKQQFKFGVVMSG